MAGRRTDSSDSSVLGEFFRRRYGPGAIVADVTQTRINKEEIRYAVCVSYVKPNGELADARHEVMMPLFGQFVYTLDEMLTPEGLAHIDSLWQKSKMFAEAYG